MNKPTFDPLESPPILSSVIDKPDQYTNEWWRQVFQRHESDIHFLKGELNEIKRLMKLSIDTINAVAANRRQDAAKLGQVISDVEVLSRRVDTASKIVQGLRGSKQEQAGVT